MDSDTRADSRMVLASRSPRRRRLLAWLDLPFDCVAFDTPEDLDSPLAHDPRALVAHLAAEKALAARDGGVADALILGFDTLVVADGELLGKPVDVADAWRMLRSLAGETHEVVTGCALLAPNDVSPRTFSVTTHVRMKPLSDADIRAWMAMGTFLGCAGAYNIEAQVASVTDDECYQNVAGLPLCHLYAALSGSPSESRPGLLASPIAACDAALHRTCRLGPKIASEAARGA